MRTLLPSMFLLLSACTYVAPVDNKLPPLNNVISGTIVADGLDQPVNAFITVYNVDEPAAPIGTGRPVTVASVPASAFTGDGDGVQSASFSVGGLADGEYYVNTLLDVDGNFNLFAHTLAGATCGDYVGTHVRDVETGVPATVVVKGGKVFDGITVLAHTQIGVQRPASFLDPTDTNFKDGAVVMKKAVGKQTGEDILATANLRYTLSATPIHIAYSDTERLDLEGPVDLADFDPCDTAFWLYGVDADGDGLVDPHPLKDAADAGIGFVWPRVYIEYLGEPVEGEVDPVGKPVFDNPYTAEKEIWAGENFTYAYENNFGSVFPAIAPVGVPTPVDSISVTWSPAIRHYYVGQPDKGEFKNIRFRGELSSYDLVDLRDPDTPLDAVPSGHWAITIMQFTGQTWILPNEAISLPSLDTTGEYDPAKQNGTLVTE